MPRLRAPGRRRFLKVLGVAGLSSAALPPLLALAQSATPPAGGPQPAKPDSTKAPEKPPEISEDAYSLTEIVRRRYGQHVSADQLAEITKEFDSRIQAGKRLKGAKLANGDEPDFAFRP